MKKSPIITVLALCILLTGCSGNAGNSGGEPDLAALEGIEIPEGPFYVEEFGEYYNLLAKAKGLPTISDYSWDPQQHRGMGSVMPQCDADYSITMTLSEEGVVLSFRVLAILLENSPYNDEDEAYRDMLPAMLTGMELLGVDAEELNQVQRLEWREVERAGSNTDPDEAIYRKTYKGDGYSLEYYLSDGEVFTMTASLGY